MLGNETFRDFRRFTIFQVGGERNEKREEDIGRHVHAQIRRHRPRDQNQHSDNDIQFNSIQFNLNWNQLHGYGWHFRFCFQSRRKNKCLSRFSRSQLAAVGSERLEHGKRMGPSRRLRGRGPSKLPSPTKPTKKKSIFSGISFNWISASECFEMMLKVLFFFETAIDLVSVSCQQRAGKV